jgi:hypothetical protein
VGENLLSAQGIPTCLRLDPARPLVVNYITAVAPVPRRFDRVAAIKAGERGVVLKSASGLAVTAPLDTALLFSQL